MKIFNILKTLAKKAASALSIANSAYNSTFTIDDKLKTAGIGTHVNNVCDTNNMLLIANRYNGGFQRVAVSNATELTNRPSAWSSGSVVCYRQVMFQYENTLAHAIVILWEVYPVPSRIWINVYNTSWRGWKSVTLT